MDFEGQELIIKIGALVCQPNLEYEAKLFIPNQLSYIENRINATDEVLVNQEEQLATLKVVHNLTSRPNLDPFKLVWTGPK